MEFLYKSKLLRPYIHLESYKMRKYIFSPLNGHTNYVKVIKDGGCWSQIGMVGGEQSLSLVGNLGGIIGITHYIDCQR